MFLKILIGISLVFGFYHAYKQEKDFLPFVKSFFSYSLSFLLASPFWLMVLIAYPISWFFGLENTPRINPRRKSSKESIKRERRSTNPTQSYKSVSTRSKPQKKRRMASTLKKDSGISISARLTQGIRAYHSEPKELMGSILPKYNLISHHPKKSYLKSF